MPGINSKLPDVGETIFTTMSVLASKHQAINLGQGFPDYPMDQELIRHVEKAMRDGHNQYVHMNGWPPLREALAKKVSELYQTDVDPNEQITITPGGTYAIYTALTTVLQPGDEVIVFEPAYDCYIPTIELNGAKAVLIALEYPDYMINWDIVRSKINSKTRMIMLNSPHNPTGAVLSKDDIQELTSIVEGTGIMILSDEVYEHLIFDGKKHESILKYPDLLQRSFVCFSFGKVYHCTGWKMGYCIAGKELMKEFRTIHQFNAFSTNSPMQVGICNYLENNKSYESLGGFLQQKRDHLQKMMKDLPFKPLPSYGSYFQLYNYSAISDEPEKEFAIMLTREAGVTTIPVSAFYKNETDNKVLRFCFAKKDSTLDEAAARLKKFLS